MLSKFRAKSCWCATGAAFGGAFDVIRYPPHDPPDCMRATDDGLE